MFDPSVDGHVVNSPPSPLSLSGRVTVVVKPAMLSAEGGREGTRFDRIKCSCLVSFLLCTNLQT
jgi:hypothetical protein